ncbi:MAG: hypothetical protein QXV69_03055 [Sulfolobaceae archaeon]
MEYFNCNVCGRKFPKGQGIIINIADETLTFHSKDCAYKFLRQVVENSEKGCISSSIKTILKKYEEMIEIKKKKSEKKI